MSFDPTDVYIHATNDVHSLTLHPAGVEIVGTPYSPLLMGSDGSQAQLILTDAAGHLQIDVLSLPSITGTVTIQDGGNTITVDGTVAATQSGAWNVNIADGGNTITVDGSVAVSSYPGPREYQSAGTGTPYGVMLLGTDYSGNVYHSKISSSGHLSIRAEATTNYIGRVRLTDGTHDLTLYQDDNINLYFVPIGGYSVGADGYGALQLAADYSVLVTAAGSGLIVQDGGNTITVDGTVAVSSLPGITGTVTIQDGGNTITVDGTVGVSAIVPGVAATNLGKAEDAAHTSGDVGVMALAVRNKDCTALAGDEFDYIPLITDDYGALWVNARAAIVSGSVKIVDNDTGYPLDLVTQGNALVSTPAYGIPVLGKDTANNAQFIPVSTPGSDVPSFSLPISGVDSAGDARNIQVDTAGRGTVATLQGRSSDVQFLSISGSSDITILAGVTDKKIKVVSYVLVAKEAIQVQFKRATTAISGIMYLAANIPLVAVGQVSSHLLETAAGEALVLATTGDVAGHICVLVEA